MVPDATTDSVGSAACIDNDSSTNIYVGCHFETLGGSVASTAFKTYASAHSTIEGCSFKVRGSETSTNDTALGVAESLSTLRCFNSVFDIGNGLVLTFGEADVAGGWIDGYHQRGTLANCVVAPQTNAILVLNRPAVGGGLNKTNFLTLSGGNITETNLLYPETTGKALVTYENMPLSGDASKLTNLGSNSFGATAIEFIQAAAPAATNWAISAITTELPTIRLRPS
jgi:hypothetical protein